MGPAILGTVMPHALQRMDTWLEPLNTAMDKFQINTPLRIAAFLANVAVESMELKYVKELASGSEYEGNHHLGNTQPGDGVRFKGRGLMQITGRKNYGLVATALGLPLLDHPEMLELPVYAAQSAGWFWTVGAGLNLSKQALTRCTAGCNLNDIADKPDFQGTVMAINGGLNGWAQRKAYYEKAKAIL